MRARFRSSSRASRFGLPLCDPTPTCLSPRLVTQHDSAPDFEPGGVRPSTEAADDASSLFQGADLYRLLVASVVDYAIFALDRSGRVRSWNPGAERLKGYRAEEILGRHFSVF